MTYDLKKEFQMLCLSLARSLSVILLIAVCLSFLARHHWLADLFSHFLIQYVIGALVLGIFYTLIRKWVMALTMLIVLISCLIELHPGSKENSEIATSKTISLMQYNRLISQTNHDDLTDFLEASSIDVVILQEAGAGLNKPLKNLRKIYPYQIIETRVHAFGMVIISRYPILAHEIIPLKGTLLDNFTIRAVIDLPDNDEDFILYALHTLPPTDREQWQERNTELARTADIIHKDRSRYIVMAGDWNVTPYSPFFKDTVRATGLEYQNTDFYPPMTWPSVFILPIFQVPIDHILFSHSLQLIEKKTGPAMGSDHYPLIATFGLPSSNH